MIKLFLIKIEGVTTSYIHIPNGNLLKEKPLGIEIRYTHQKRNASLFRSKEVAESILDKYIILRKDDINIYSIEEIYINENELKAFSFVSI